MVQQSNALAMVVAHRQRTIADDIATVAVAPPIAGNAVAHMLLPFRAAEP